MDKRDEEEVQGVQEGCTGRDETGEDRRQGVGDGRVLGGTEVKVRSLNKRSEHRKQKRGNCGTPVRHRRGGDRDPELGRGFRLDLFVSIVSDSTRLPEVMGSLIVTRGGCGP